MTISEQIDKLEKEYSPSGNIPYDNTPDGVRNARSLHDAMQIIRALTAPPTEAEIEAVARAGMKACQEFYAGSGIADPKDMEFALSVHKHVAKAAISAFQKARGV